MNQALVLLAVEFVDAISPQKIQAITSSLPEQLEEQATNDVGRLLNDGPKQTFFALIELAKLHSVGGKEISALLLGASSSRAKILEENNVEFVWTGPTTEFVSTRQTAQVLYDLIDHVKHELFLVSFVVNDVDGLLIKLNDAIHRGVKVSLLLEAPKDRGGSLDRDNISMMSREVPKMKIYSWAKESWENGESKVHAKMAVADGEKAFLTSANLTGHAMNKNIEAGLLLTGSQVPAQIMSHMTALIDTKVLIEM